MASITYRLEQGRLEHQHKEGEDFRQVECCKISQPCTIACAAFEVCTSLDDPRGDVLLHCCGRGLQDIYFKVTT